MVVRGWIRQTAAVHPAVFADVPMRGIAGIGRMVEVGDALLAARRHRTAVIHPAGWFPKMAGSPCRPSLSVNCPPPKYAERFLATRTARKPKFVLPNSSVRLRGRKVACSSTSVSPSAGRTAATSSCSTSGCGSCPSNHPSARPWRLRRRHPGRRAIASAGCVLRSVRSRNRCPAPWRGQTRSNGDGRGSVRPDGPSASASCRWGPAADRKTAAGSVRPEVPAQPLGTIQDK